MKAQELLIKHPPQFLVWNLNEDTGVLWTDLSLLEDNGFFDPWGQRINISTAKQIRNRLGDVTQYHVIAECQGYPVELVIVNE
jgi:hypothetical protein